MAKTMSIRTVANTEKNKSGLNNDASWMKEDEEEDEDKDEEDDSLITSKEPFRMITMLVSARFTV